MKSVITRFSVITWHYLCHCNLSIVIKDSIFTLVLDQYSVFSIKCHLPYSVSSFIDFKFLHWQLYVLTSFKYQRIGCLNFQCFVIQKIQSWCWQIFQCLGCLNLGLYVVVVFGVLALLLRFFYGVAQMLSNLNLLCPFSPTVAVVVVVITASCYKGSVHHAPHCSHRPLDHNLSCSLRFFPPEFQLPLVWRLQYHHRFLVVE